MRKVLLSAVCMVCLCATGSRGDDTAEFFNGKNTEGWEGLKELWKVEDGAIVGDTGKGINFNTFLCSKKKYRDFELKFPVASDRHLDWPSHPNATRDSLHEHDMWVAEGLTHRYPTKVLAELLSTCPQYCGHCTRMDLVGNSTPVVPKLSVSVAGNSEKISPQPKNTSPDSTTSRNGSVRYCSIR